MASPLENAKKLYDAWHSHDMPTVMSLVSEDVTFYIWNPSVSGAKPGVPMSGVWKGKEGVAQYGKALYESIDIMKDEILGFSGSGNDVFVKQYVECKVKATGKVFKTDMLHHWTANDAGLFTQMDEYCDTDAVVKAHQA